MQSIEVELKKAIQNAVKKAFDLDLDVQNIVVETPKNKDHGDFSSNVAMQLTRQLHQNPRMIAQSLLDAFSLEMVSNIEIAGPGFLNFTLSKDRFSTVISDVFRTALSFLFLISQYGNTIHDIPPLPFDVLPFVVPIIKKLEIFSIILSRNDRK